MINICIWLLIDGYIRIIQQLLKDKIIPTSINKICFKFYQIIIDVDIEYNIQYTKAINTY